MKQESIATVDVSLFMGLVDKKNIKPRPDPLFTLFVLQLTSYFLLISLQTSRLRLWLRCISVGYVSLTSLSSFLHLLVSYVSPAYC